MEHTKGEWKAIDFKDTLDLFEHGHFQIVGDNQRKNVAIIPAHWNDAKANARLIASAPDLYEVLRKWQDGGFNSQLEFASAVRQAIAKVEGD